jgi:hypothetical protein
MPQPLDVFANAAGGIASGKQYCAQREHQQKFYRVVHLPCLRLMTCCFLNGYFLDGYSRRSTLLRQPSMA